MSEVPGLGDLGLAPAATDMIDPAHARRLARTIDLDDGVLADGALPLTWIWVFFAPDAPTAALREDGHPRTEAGGALGGLTQRMWLGGALEASAPIALGVETRRVSTVLSADHKEGSTGPFLIVGLEHRYHQDDRLVLTERQQVMYRAPAKASAPPPGPSTEPPATDGLTETRRPDERLLFRYSALTFNTHRIHYDLPYTTTVEGHHGLVVHGPLTATLLAGVAARRLGAPLTSFTCRAQTPSYAGLDLHLVAETTADGEVVRAIRADGATVMTGTAVSASRSGERP
ncbi:MAG: acyl-CoA dehydrogenase [Desertimonas sp.]